MRHPSHGWGRRFNPYSALHHNLLIWLLFPRNQGEPVALRASCHPIPPAAENRGDGEEDNPDDDGKRNPPPRIAKGYGDGDQGHPEDKREEQDGEVRVHDRRRGLHTASSLAWSGCAFIARWIAFPAANATIPRGKLRSNCSAPVCRGQLSASPLQLLDRHDRSGL